MPLGKAGLLVPVTRVAHTAASLDAWSLERTLVTKGSQSGNGVEAGHATPENTGVGYRLVFVIALGIFMAILYYAVRHIGAAGR
jgi:hypothetical protein